MSADTPIVGTRKARRLIRTLLTVNFVLLFLLIGPGSSHKLYVAEKRLGIAHIIVHTLQFWFIASTILAAALFARTVVSRSEVWRSQRPTKLDWALFVVWAVVVAIFCLFAFMMGMGG
jgi:hypothetical protein